MIIFNGEESAQELEQQLTAQVSLLKERGKGLKIAAILFIEDKGSQLYTALKAQAATRVGIEYEVFEFSIAKSVELVVEQIKLLNQDQSVTGIIIQKPMRKTWVKEKGIATDKSPKAIRRAFSAWWQLLTSQIKLAKDVDGLHPETLAAVKDNFWQKKGLVLPATASAVLTILQRAFAQLKIDENKQKQLQVLILGRSDIVGLPVFYELINQGFQVKLLTRDDVSQRLESGKYFTDADIIISATGVKHLITAGMMKPGAIVVDVGEPRPDVDLESTKKLSIDKQPAFITPVPGGVGPMTVASLLKNCVDLVHQP
jgi:methylenetetrahydrofolate dehydrogenase (NADP+)/methenyltetrahydrofolate cyclohydrolase